MTLIFHFIDQSRFELDDTIYTVQSTVEIAFSKNQGSITLLDEANDRAVCLSASDFKKFISDNYNGDENPNHFIKLRS